ncbi:LysR family transcriptional regulator [Acetobacteraceae bacterium KSS8]|uniref:LysR family transcriptional regulator n=1 Tax=Endosaccharibacter trunci TaxID=2812733 RepID=A0ABT1WE81_9PROT|nr:LysR family transcriptional regulator [Acetobacteraceae bacterium KSS8]
MLRHMRVWRYLDEVARSGSVRQAAERLNVTPSAVLRRIQDVEEDVGEALFERTSSGMMLTVAGELFIDWIRRQAADLDMVKSQIEEVAGVRRGSIRLACSQAAAASFIPHAVALFQKTHADVVFSISTASHEQAIRMLVQYEVDLALIFGPPLRSEVRAYMSIGQRVVAVMRQDHPLAEQPALRLRHCMEYPLALLDRGFSGRRLLDSIMAGISTPPNIVLEANSFEPLAAYVRHSDAVTFQVQIGIDDIAAGHGLAVRALLDEDKAFAPLVLLHLKGRSLPVAARRFADTISRGLDELRMEPLDG